MTRGQLTTVSPAGVRRDSARHGWKSMVSARMCWLIIASGLLLAGCHHGGRREVGLPGRHSLRADQLLVLSDFKLPAEHPLIQDLVQLRREVSRELSLPVKSEEVVVYLFSDELTYHKYIQSSHPGLPSRRAYFIATPQELAVYTYWGERVQEDLRHEYTHGLLHACLDHVPLWLDEGLAEYFELSGTRPGQIQADYVERLTTAISNGWQPDLSRLEQLEKVDQMQRADYREAWAWVHFCLHGSDDTRQILLTYLHELQSPGTPETLQARLIRETTEPDQRLLAYLATLQSPIGQASVRTVQSLE